MYRSNYTNCKIGIHAPVEGGGQEMPAMMLRATELMFILMSTLNMFLLKEGTIRITVLEYPNNYFTWACTSNNTIVLFK